METFDSCINNLYVLVYVLNNHYGYTRTHTYINFIVRIIYHGMELCKYETEETKFIVNSSVGYCGVLFKSRVFNFANIGFDLRVIRWFID